MHYPWEHIRWSRYKIPHDLIRYYPDHLKTSGYYVGNYKKTDYNIGGRKDTDCWDNSEEVDWDKLKNTQPFFQVINSGSRMKVVPSVIFRKPSTP